MAVVCAEWMEFSSAKYMRNGGLNLSNTSLQATAAGQKERRKRLRPSRGSATRSTKKVDIKEFIPS